MKENIHIGWCPIDKVPELQTLIDRYWRKNHIFARSQELLKWQYQEKNPDQCSLVIAENAQNEIIGCLGFIQAPFNDNGNRRFALWMSMWLLAPEARGQGIGFAMLEHAMKDNHEVIACIGFNDITRRLVAGLNFEIQDVIPRWVRPISLENLLTLTSAREQPYSGDIQAIWRNSFDVTPQVTHEVIDWSPEAGKLWDIAWHQRFAPQLLSTWHDREYIEWRYVNHPTFSYCVKVVNSANQVDGLLVYRLELIQHREEKVLRVLEFMGTPEAVDLLIGNLLHAGVENNVAFIDFYCTETKLSSKLEQYGFYRDDQLPEQDRLPRLFQPLDFRTNPLNITIWIRPDIHPDNHQFFTGDKLYFTRADGDQDRPN
jgi:hypothetical protein